MGQSTVYFCKPSFNSGSPVPVAQDHGYWANAFFPQGAPEETQIPAENPEGAWAAVQILEGPEAGHDPVQGGLLRRPRN